MNTIRTFTAQFTNSTVGNSIIYYKPGNIPLPVSTDRVSANVEYFNLVCDLPNLPVVNEYSGRTIQFLLKVGDGNAFPIGRIDLRPAVVSYTVDVLTLLFGTRLPVLSPDTELSARLIDTGYGFLSANETLTIYGSATEEIEYNNETLIQQLN